jgi:hypothetical protein
VEPQTATRALARACPLDDQPRPADRPRASLGIEVIRGPMPPWV